MKEKCACNSGNNAMVCRGAFFFADACVTVHHVCACRFCKESLLAQQKPSVLPFKFQQTQKHHDSKKSMIKKLWLGMRKKAFALNTFSAQHFDARFPSSFMPPFFRRQEKGELPEYKRWMLLIFGRTVAQGIKMLFEKQFLRVINPQASSRVLDHQERLMAPDDLTGKFCD